MDLRPASTGLIVAAGLGVAKITLLNLPKYKITQNLIDTLNYKSIILALIIFGIMKKFDLHPIVLILIAAIIGIAFKILINNFISIFLVKKYSKFEKNMI